MRGEVAAVARPVRAYLGYAALGAGLLALFSGLLGLLLGAAAAPSVWWAAAVAYVVQLLAFAALLRFRARPNAFLVVWAGGILMRLAVVLAGAYWVSQWPVLQPAPALLSLAGFLFVLLLLEPVFFFVGLREG